MLQRAIANRPAVEKQVLHAVIGAAVAGTGHVAAQANRRSSALSTEIRSAGQLVAKEAPRCAPASRRRPADRRPTRPWWRKRAMHVRVGQRNARERLADVPHLGLRRAQELPPHGRIVEQLPDFDRGAHRAATGRDRRGMSAGHFELRAGIELARAAAHRQAAHFGDRRQRLAAKAQRMDAKQIVGVAYLAGGVAGHGQRQLLGGNAAAVVADAHQLQPALLHRHVDPRGAGIDRSSPSTP